MAVTPGYFSSECDISISSADLEKLIRKAYVEGLVDGYKQKNQSAPSEKGWRDTESLSAVTRLKTKKGI